MKRNNVENVKSKVDIVIDSMIEVFKDIPAELFSQKSRAYVEQILAESEEIDMTVIPKELFKQMGYVLT